MRHRVAGKRLNRTSSHRKAMRRNMAASLFEHGAIRTTETKAKDVKRFVERLITIARRGTLHARRQVISLLGDRRIIGTDGEQLDKTVITKLFDEIAPRYADRPGGYSRIIRLSDRRIGDAGSQVLLQLIAEGEAESADDVTAASRRKRRASKRHEAAAGIEAATASAAEPDQTVEESAEEPEDVEADQQQRGEGEADQDKAE